MRLVRVLVDFPSLTSIFVFSTISSYDSNYATYNSLCSTSTEAVIKIQHLDKTNFRGNRITTAIYLYPPGPEVVMDTSHVCQSNLDALSDSDSDSVFLNRYTQKQILDVQTAHRRASSWQDKVALSTVKVLRWGMDFVTGYGSPSNTSVSKTAVMTEQKWITRFIFLESVAGVPGMVAGMLRHLKSIRMMRRDHGW